MAHLATGSFQKITAELLYLRVEMCGPIRFCHVLGVDRVDAPGLDMVLILFSQPGLAAAANTTAATVHDFDEVIAAVSASDKLLTRAGLKTLLANCNDIQPDDQQCGQYIRHRLGPYQTGDAQHGFQDKQSRDIEDALATEVDDQGRRRRAHGLQGVGEHIEDAEQNAGGQQYVDKLHRIAKGVRVGEERAYDLVCQEIAGSRHHCAQRQRRPEGKAHHLFEPVPQPCAHTVAQQGLDALAEADADHAGDHGHLHGHTDCRHRHIAVARHHAVDHDLRDVHQHGAEGGRDADSQHSGANPVFDSEVSGVDAQGGAASQEIENIVPGAHYIADDGGDGSPGDAPIEGKDHDGIQHHVGQVANDLPHHRLGGFALSANDVVIAVGDQYKRPAEGDYGQICFGRFPGIGACAHQRQNSVHKDQKQGGQDHAYHHAAPHTEGAYLLCVVRLSLTHGPGDHRGAADAKDGAHGHEHQKHRRRQRYRRDQNVVMRLPDEKGVRQIVDQHHDHGGHGGDRVFRDRFPDGHMTESIHLICLFHENRLLLLSQYPPK